MSRGNSVSYVLGALPIMGLIVKCRIDGERGRTSGRRARQGCLAFSPRMWIIATPDQYGFLVQYFQFFILAQLQITNRTYVTWP